MVLVEGGKVRKRFFLHTSREKVEPGALRRLFGANLRKIDDIVVVSVVPKFRAVVKKSLSSVIPKVKARFVGSNIRVPMKIKYRDPREVGQDRLVTAFAARKVYGAPVLVIDFGTAVTFDFVSGKGEYEGGLIFPGLRLGLKSLAADAALLPKIELEATRGLIGRDTRASMNNGILFGYAAVCDRIVELCREKYGKNIKVVATGGDAKLIAKYTRHVKTTHPDLIFTGLGLLTSD